MNKTKIEWCDFTWNPVTGCKHGCKYCYARKMAARWDRVECDRCDGRGIDRPSDPPKYHINCIKCNGYGTMPAPGYFDPKFHPERLDQPAKRKKPTRIFVVSMGDLFGEWVPDEWIEQVFAACEAAPQHTYYFLTKNPDRYTHFIGTPLWDYAIKKNMWFGATTVEAADGLSALISPGFNTFVSAEPLKGPLQLDIYYELHSESPHPHWLIVGAQSRPDTLPEKEWILDIRKQCADLKIPLFEKNSLAPLDLPGGLIQELHPKMQMFREDHNEKS